MEDGIYEWIMEALYCEPNDWRTSENGSKHQMISCSHIYKQTKLKKKMASMSQCLHYTGNVVQEMEHEPYYFKKEGALTREINHRNNY